MESLVTKPNPSYSRRISIVGETTQLKRSVLPRTDASKFHLPFWAVSETRQASPRFSTTPTCTNLFQRCHGRQRERVSTIESIVFRWFFQAREAFHDEIRGREETAEIWDLVGKECKSSLPPGTRINSIPRWIQESVPRKYEIGEHKFVRIYGRPRTNVSTSGRVLPTLGPPSTSESISQVLHPPSKGTLPPLDRNFPRYAFIIYFSLSFSKFHRSLSRLLSRTKRCNNRICECEYSISTIRV